MVLLNASRGAKNGWNNATPFAGAVPTSIKVMKLFLNFPIPKIFEFTATRFDTIAALNSLIWFLSSVCE